MAQEIRNFPFLNWMMPIDKSDLERTVTQAGWDSVYFDSKTDMIAAVRAPLSGKIEKIEKDPRDKDFWGGSPEDTRWITYIRSQPDGPSGIQIVNVVSGLDKEDLLLPQSEVKRGDIVGYAGLRDPDRGPNDLDHAWTVYVNSPSFEGFTNPLELAESTGSISDFKEALKKPENSKRSTNAIIIPPPPPDKSGLTWVALGVAAWFVWKKG